MHAYQEKMTDGETVSIWQSLTYGANYKAVYCIAVCPAGEDIISPFLSNKAAFIQSVLNPLQEKSETVYAVKGSDAAEHVSRRFPKKQIKLREVRFKSQKCRRVYIWCKTGISTQSIQGYRCPISFFAER